MFEKLLKTALPGLWSNFRPVYYPEHQRTAHFLFRFERLNLGADDVYRLELLGQVLLHFLGFEFGHLGRQVLHLRRLGDSERRI